MAESVTEQKITDLCELPQQLLVNGLQLLQRCPFCFAHHPLS